MSKTYCVIGAGGCGGSIASVVAGIVPTAGDINFLVRAVNSGERIVAGNVTERVVNDLTAASLEIEHTDGFIEEIVINRVGDGKRIGIVEAAAGDVIFAGFGDFGKGSDPVCFAGRCILYGFGKRSGVDGFFRVSVHNGKFGFGSNASEYSTLCAVGTIAELVGEDRSLIALCSGIIDRTVINQFECNIVDIDGMFGEIFALCAAVEYELGHDIGFVFHGKVIGDSLRFGGEVKSLPGISLIGTAVLLNHCFDIAVQRAGNVVADVIDAVLIKGNDVVEYLNSIIDFANAFNGKSELSVACAERAGAAAFLIGTPVGSIGVES